MIVSAGTVLRVLYDSEDVAVTQIANWKEGARAFAERTEPVVGWVPDEFADRFESFVLRMRENRRYALMMLSIALVILALINGGARYLQGYFSGSIGARVTTRLNSEMYRNIVSLPHEFFEGRTTGEITARFTNDAFMVNRGLTKMFVHVLQEPFKIAFCIGLAFTINSTITIIVVFVVSPLVFAILYIGRRLRVSVRGSLDKIANIASLVNETISGITVVKAFRMERYLQTRMDHQTRRLRSYLMRMASAEAAVSPVTEVLMVFGVVAFVLYSDTLITGNVLTPGQLMMLFGALAAVLDPVRKLANLNNLLQTSVSSGERAFEFIDLKSNLPERSDAVDLAPLREAIRFEDVAFSYDGQTDALHGIDLTFGTNEMIALVGFSGSGKSTLAKLIPRFYDPTAGRITFDGVDVRDVSLESLRNQIALVTQDTILFNETVRNNIAYGRDDLADEQIRDAARKAHAAEFIERLPAGYDTMLDEAGGNLSAGQRQRLAIARAIVKNPRVLVLDEATSNLDAESEREIQKAIEEFVVGRTAIVIAHRLATVRQADRIVVLDQGEIAEQGTHETLLARGGIFERLYRLQFAQEKRETGSA